MSLRALVAVALAMLLFAGTGSGACRAAEPVAEVPSTPGKDNGFDVVNEAIEGLVVWSDEERERFQSILRGDEWDQAFVEMLLAKNGTWYEQIEEALHCPRFRVPPIQSFDTPQTYLPEWRQIARLSSMRALYLFKTGNEKEAFDECMRTVAFGHAIQCAHGNLLVYLVGIAVQEIGLKEFRALLAETTLGRETLEPYIARIGHYRLTGSGLAHALATEYVVFQNLIDALASGKLSTDPPMKVASTPLQRAMLPLVFDPERTKNALATAIVRMIRSAPKHYADADMRLPEVPDMGTRRSHFLLLVSGNAVGKILVGMLLPAQSRSLQQKCTQNCSIAATQVSIALRCYQLEHGELPDALDALVPKYFDAVPLDDFDGKPMRYSKEKKVIYSVGADLIDSGGADETSRDPKEPTFKIGF
jgi:hypothetical protein